MLVSRRSFAAVAASGILAAQTAHAAPQLGNPDNPPQGPEAIKGNPHSSNDPGLSANPLAPAGTDLLLRPCREKPLDASSPRRLDGRTIS